MNTELKCLLLSPHAMNLEHWGDVEWFGIEEYYIPYPYLDDYMLGYCQADAQGSISMEVEETFPFIVAYKNGEYLATFEFPFILESGQVITIKEFGLKIRTP